MKKYKYIIAGLFLTTALQSCDLERFPESSIEKTMAFQKVTDAEKWANNFHAQLRARIYGVYTLASDIQSDMLNATAEYGNVYGAVHRWSGDFNSDNYEIRDVWQGYYAALKNANYAIEKFPTIPVANTAEQEKMNKYTGDAYFTRAYYYLNLALRYSKAYSSTTAASDLGVPLILKFDLQGIPTRSTLKETYDQILSDIAKAKELLANSPGKAGAQTFSLDAVLALEARTKLYMGDLTGAKAAAELIITGGKYKLYNSAAGVKSLWATDATQETILQLFCNTTTERPNQNSAYYGFEAANNRYRSTFIPSKWVVDTYSNADFRKATYFKEADLYQGGKNHKVYIVNKYPGNPTLVTSAAENYNAPKIFRVAEMYLISAEAAAVSDPGLALVRLNDLRTSRGLNALSGLSAGDLLKEIKAERFRELAFEGFRLDDLKRWNEPMTRKEPQGGSEILNVGEGFVAKSVPAGDDKFVWGIPGFEMVLHKATLVQNPGW